MSDRCSLESWSGGVHYRFPTGSLVILILTATLSLSLGISLARETVVCLFSRGHPPAPLSNIRIPLETHPRLRALPGSPAGRERVLEVRFHTNHPLREVVRVRNRVASHSLSSVALSLYRDESNLNYRYHEDKGRSRVSEGRWLYRLCSIAPRLHIAGRNV